MKIKRAPNLKRAAPLGPSALRVATTDLQRHDAIAHRAATSGVDPFHAAGTLALEPQQAAPRRRRIA